MLTDDEFNKQFTDEKVIEHSSGNIIRAVYKEKTVILKKYKARNLDNYNREIIFLEKLNREPNIIQLIQHHKFNNCEGTLVIEDMDKDLFEYLDGDIQFDLKNVMKQLLTAAESCRENNVLHRDIKCENIFMNKDGLLKLGDFDHSIMLHDVANQHKSKNELKMTSLQKTHQGTLDYRAPEYLLGCNNVTYAYDIWSIGCVFAILISGAKLINSEKPSTALPNISYADQCFNELAKIFQFFGRPSDEEWPEFNKLPLFQKEFSKYPIYTRQEIINKLKKFTKNDQYLDLLSKMFILNPTYRITAKDALNHPLFTQ